MNSVNLVGNLTRDPEARETGTTTVCSFTLAIDRAKDGVDFPRIKCFGKTAENCMRYLSKGRKVAVSGRISTGSYEKDGRTVYTTDVIADRVEFLNGVKMESATEETAVPDDFAQIDADIPF